MLISEDFIFKGKGKVNPILVFINIPTGVGGILSNNLTSFYKITPIHSSLQKLWK